MALYLCSFHLTFSLPGAVQVAIARTTAFRSDFSDLRIETSVHPDWPIILEPNSPWDYEVVYAFNVWQSFFKVKNPLLLRPVITRKDINGEFEQGLTDQMQIWGMEGLPGKFLPLPDPASLTRIEKRCFAVGHWRPVVSPCVKLKFKPKWYFPGRENDPG